MSEGADEMDVKVPIAIALGEFIAIVVLAVFLFTGGGVSCDDERVGSVTTNLKGGGLTISQTVNCRVPTDGSLQASIIIEPDSPDVTPLDEEPLTCTVGLERDGEMLAEQVTRNIDEFGMQVLEPPQVPEDAEPGPASSVVSCEQAGQEVFTSEEEVFIEPKASTEIPTMEIPAGETPATEIPTPTPFANEPIGGEPPQQAQ